MPFVRTVPEEQAEGEVAAIFQVDRERIGYLPNYSTTFSLRPAVYQAWRGLIGAIVRNMEERRFELATVAAARRLRSSYCSLAHGKILRDKFFDGAVVARLADDPLGAGLGERESAIVELAGKVAEDATTVTQEDIDRLRSAGLGDEEIFDVIVAAAARCFFSKVLDATGTLPDREYRDLLEPELLGALVVGRPIEE